MQNVKHDHRYEFVHFDGAESVFRCILPGCKDECVEPEDSGTGA